MLIESINQYFAKKKLIKNKKKRKEFKKKFWLNDFMEILNLKIFVIPFIWLLDRFYLKDARIFLLPTRNLPFEWHNDDELCVGMKCGYIIYLWNFKQNGEHEAIIVIKPTEEKIWKKMIQENTVEIDSMKM